MSTFADLKSLAEERQRLWLIKTEAKEGHDRSWEYIKVLQSRYGPRIDSLNAEHDRTYRDMRQAYDRASNAYESGDHTGASSYSSEGRSLKARLPGLVEERRTLVAELKEAQAKHEGWRAYLKACNEAFYAAKQRYDEAFEQFKHEQQAYIRQAGVNTHGEDLYIKEREDGNTDILFGGYGSPDGPGHGHIVIGPYGNLIHVREAEKYMPRTTPGKDGYHERIIFDDERGIRK